MYFTNPFLNALARIYNFFVKSGNNLQSLFLFYMRLTWGHQFFLAGRGKLEAIEKVILFFTSLHIPHPAFHAYLVSILEAVGGFLLLIGLGSRIAAIPLIIIMLTALSTAHAPNLSHFRFLFEPLSLVREEPYPFLITAVLVFVFGPGRISIDAWIKRWADRQPKF